MSCMIKQVRSYNLANFPAFKIGTTSYGIEILPSICYCHNSKKPKDACHVSITWFRISSGKRSLAVFDSLLDEVLSSSFVNDKIKEELIFNIDLFL